MKRKIPVFKATWKTIDVVINRAAKFIKEKAVEDYRNASVDDIKDQFIYRGQSDAVWKLETTLERHVKRPVTIDEYESFACDVASRMKGVVSKIPKNRKRKHWLESNAYRLQKEQALLNQTLLSHLRHYGLPSPLLDWSSSRYVAAFFAFSEMPQGSKKAAIYIHLPQSKKKSDYLFKAAPGIHRVKPGYNPNQRHYDQKCVHTISIQLIDKKENFVTHEESACDSFIAKIEIKSSERDAIMKDLSDMGISRFKLYGGEDSLVKDLWDEKKARMIRLK
jgi:5-methylcytosine-specific restriction endonuclease McrA